MKRTKWIAVSFLAASCLGHAMGVDDFRIRDPYVFVDGGKYYLYESKPWFGGREVKVRTSSDLVNWTEPSIALVLPEDVPCTAIWAPEVHKYSGKYYLFVTITERKGSRQVVAMGPAANENFLVPRGTWGFVSETPLGPFNPLKRGPLPPAELMTLDGTLLVENGQPYLVYCHEWCQMGSGTIEFARLKDDLTGLAESPRVLLTADTTVLGAGHVTDGCYFYRSSRSGVLHMIWSNFVKGHGYCVLTRRSVSGRLVGPWENDEILFGENGGHGMIFTGLDGILRLTIHQPNENEKERMKMYVLKELGGRLSIDFHATKVNGNESGNYLPGEESH
ncbi:MAG: family 43 glycosylhydrolase [bacterium]|nr:family 43 glycosylhydrolase [Candidatus Colisoma equi]